MKRIGIIGGGAVGLLLASYLAERHDVTLYTRTKTGFAFVERDGKKGERPVRLAKIDRFETPDLVFVATKSYDVTDVIPYLEKIEVPVVFLQNGMGHIEAASRVKRPIFAVNEHGAMRGGELRVLHTGKGRIRYGDERVGLEELSPELAFEFAPPIAPVMIAKLFINAVVNPITAVHGVRNGEILTSPELLEDAMGIYREMCLLFPKADVGFETIRGVIERTGMNRSSMLEDVSNGRRTEIEPIVGFALAHGGEKAPLLRRYYEEVKRREER